MTEVLDVLARGGDFATVASSFSDDRKTAAAGGDPGWVKLAALNPEQMIVLSQLKTGQVSPPFLSRDGYLLVKLEGRSGDNVRFRQILVRVPVTAADSARAKGLAQSLKKKLAAGASFDSLATKYSQDPTTSDSGGRLGEYLISGLSAPFNKVVAAMDSGAVSDPVLSDHGYHLIKALAKQPEKTLTFLEMQDNIRNYLSQQEMERRMKEYVERISDKVFVKRFELAAQPGR
jgi:peptidyl-prolyl cis-trans isomerase SurA